MAGYVRRTRKELGISMQDLASRLGVGVQAVSALEISDERGTIKAETRERALKALKKRSITVVIDDEETDADAVLDAHVRKIVADVAWNMGLEGRTLSNDTIERLVQKELAAERATFRVRQ